MRLRSSHAHWFETYVPRVETVLALEALADTGVVELEAEEKLAHPLALQQVRAALAEFDSLCSQHRDLLPERTPTTAGLAEEPEKMAVESLERLRTAFARMDGLLQEQRTLEAERRNLLLLRECLAAFHGDSSSLPGLPRASGFLYKRLFACPRRLCVEPGLGTVVGECVTGEEHDFFVVADLPGRAAEVDAAYSSEACLWLEVPDWLSPSPDEQQRQVAARLGVLEEQMATLSRALAEVRQEPGLAAAVADLALLRWFVGHAASMSETQQLCHVTGWTTAERTDELQEVFHRAHIHARIRYASPPVFSTAPVSMRLLPWARPFYFFIRMMGVPDRTEIDPSHLLPVIVPLLFGYMFPDVGHGLLLAALAALLYRRWPEGRFLVPCGLSAAGFGLVFGEVFGIHGLLPTLWFKPMDDPLTVLAVPLAFGAGLMMLGLVFNGIEAWWRGEAGAWLRSDAALLVLYGAAVAGLFCTACLWLVPVALLWFVAGRVYAATSDRLAQFAGSLGQVLGSTFGLLLNTISFLRVGVFALAHAALSQAALTLIGDIQHPLLYGLLFAMAHVLIVVVEGLLVFVQTTRLVLFEFFTRFLRAGGRVFRPLGMPPQH